MRKLEITLEEISMEEKEEKPVPECNSEYEGLKLIGERIYASGTSIKYWM